jgi:hypothetical protein
LTDDYSIAIGPKGYHGPLEDRDLKKTQYVKADGLTPVKKIGKIVFD